MRRNCRKNRSAKFLINILPVKDKLVQYAKEDFWLASLNLCLDAFDILLTTLSEHSTVLDDFLGRLSVGESLSEERLFLANFTFRLRLGLVDLPLRFLCALILRCFLSDGFATPINFLLDKLVETRWEDLKVVFDWLLSLYKNREKKNSISIVKLFVFIRFIIYFGFGNIHLTSQEFNERVSSRINQNGIAEQNESQFKTVR